MSNGDRVANLSSVRTSFDVVVFVSAYPPLLHPLTRSLSRLLVGLRIGLTSRLVIGWVMS